MDERIVYLHGNFDLKIVGAQQLPNSAAEEEGDVIQERNNPRPRKIIASDPYVEVVAVLPLQRVTLARTRVINNSKNPVWNETFVIPLAHPVTHLEFQVKANTFLRAKLGAKLVGKVNIPVHKIASGEYISDWFPIVRWSEGRTLQPGTALRLEIKFTPCERNPLYRYGIAGDPEQGGVRNTYFPLRKGNQVTLYQDAHVKEGSLPHVELEGGQVYKPGTCWEDICYAISEARHLVYIVGWSLSEKIKLIREPTRPLPRGGDLTLGDLLRYKSEEGVRVLLLIWKDKTSHDKLGVTTEGVMGTHDKETTKFFNHSSVNCMLAGRCDISEHNFIKQQIVGTIFTHHQKCVIVDTQASGNVRRITSFIGGIDLCDGRYDTPEHRLFHDRDTVFKDDFHNSTYHAGTKAPRQPWHDLHCRFEGHSAYDVLLNFEQLWEKATQCTGYTLNLKRFSYWHDDSLLKIERIKGIPCPPQSVASDRTTLVRPDDNIVQVSKEENPETWHVQIFRSIDSGSVKGFPNDVDKAENQSLIRSKDEVIDKSIQTAYIQAIRSAQHYIYIENQYFLGSAYAWPSHKNAGADNLIPMELALKIASKIKANERFAVYVIIPMRPEGGSKTKAVQDILFWQLALKIASKIKANERFAVYVIIPMRPEGGSKTKAVQDILFWQSQTMQMMYSVVAQALKDKLMNAHPQDYLNFYCLGNREEMPNVSTSSHERVSESQKHQRFMIYVHSKGMIVDDEYVIVGSANINERSMAGTRDTEIAMGAYQPHHAWAKNKRHPHGQIYGYRNSLWAEHLGELEACFEEPESLECVRTVNQIAGDNWDRFTDENFRRLRGHLLNYPLKVEADGKLSPLPGHEKFPDTGGKVIGTRSRILNRRLTT